MRLELTCTGPDLEGRVAVRLVVLNDSFEPEQLDRRLLIGPQPAVADPPLLSTEAVSADSAANLVLLNPWGLYGRERGYQYRSGRVTFHGYLLRRPADTLLPTGPGDPALLRAAAPPLTVRFDLPG
jgi:hypothetical protein